MRKSPPRPRNAASAVNGSKSLNNRLRLPLGLSHSLNLNRSPNFSLNRSPNLSHNLSHNLRPNLSPNLSRPHPLLLRLLLRPPLLPPRSRTARSRKASSRLIWSTAF